MIDPRYVTTMAAYNRWQNENLYGAASTLSDEERKRDRGAFFGSIHATLNHILWADRLWMQRLAGVPVERPVPIKESPQLYEAWADLCHVRTAFDATITDWAESLTPDALDGELTWHSGALKRDVTRPRAFLVVHMFNHQTHHRGQVHALLTAAGARPSDTDMPFMSA